MEELHPSHVLTLIPIANFKECENCRACECHEKRKLIQPCPNAIEL